MNFLVYILSCSDKSFYVGISGNLKNRIKEHADGAVPYTKNRKPFSIVYQESFNSRIQAAKREKEIKGWRREKKLQLINSLR